MLCVHAFYYANNIFNIPCCPMHIGVCPSCSTHSQQQQQQQPQLPRQQQQQQQWLSSQHQRLQVLLDDTPPTRGNQDSLLAQQLRPSASAPLLDFAPRQLRRQVENSSCIAAPRVLEDYAPRQVPVDTRQQRPGQILPLRNAGGKKLRQDPAGPTGSGKNDIDYGEAAAIDGGVNQPGAALTGGVGWSGWMALGLPDGQR